MVMTKEQKNAEEQYYNNALAQIQKGIAGRRKIKKEELFLMRQFHKIGFEGGIKSTQTTKWTTEEPGAQDVAA